jgi:hypothetical protein
MHCHVTELAFALVQSRGTPEEARALTGLWMSINIFDPLEATLGEALCFATKDELAELCSELSYIQVT